MSLITVLWGSDLLSGFFELITGFLYVKERKCKSLVFWANHTNQKEQCERVSHGCSFVKSDRSKSLKSLFKKERMRKEGYERLDLGHKKGKNCQKRMKNTNFLSKSIVFSKRFAWIMSKSQTSLFLTPKFHCQGPKRALTFSGA